LRHATELSHLLQSPVFDNTVASKPILITVSDGGPDHRVTYVSVQPSLICLFMTLDLNMLVVASTCPYQLWQNIVESVILTLNLPLMNTAHARKTEMERLLHHNKMLNEVRDIAAQHPGLGKALVDSM